MRSSRGDVSARGARVTRVAFASLIAALAFAFASMVFLPAARAHLGHVVVRAERYLKIDFEETQARLVVSLMLGPDETLRVAYAADTDEDGAVSQAEADAYMAEWGRGLTTELTLEVDGAPVVMRWDEPWMAPIGAIDRVPSTVEMVARIPLAPGEHTLRLRDGMRVETFDRTDVNVTASAAGVVLLAAGVGDEPSGLGERFAYGPHNAPEHVTVVVRVPGMPHALRWFAMGGGVLFVLITVAGWIAFVRRRLAARRPAD